LHQKQSNDDVFNYIMDYGVYISSGDPKAEKFAKDIPEPHK